jgi:hypothetical protein
LIVSFIIRTIGIMTSKRHLSLWTQLHFSYRDGMSGNVSFATATGGETLCATSECETRMTGNKIPSTVQTKGFSPVCDRICCFKALF